MESQRRNIDEFLAGLRRRERSVGVWGCGAIGSSAAFYLAQAGLRCIGYDIVEDRVRDMRQGRFLSTSTVVESDSGPGFPLDVTATSDWRDLETADVGVHLVCVPTERAAEPSSAALQDVMPRIARVVRATDGSAAPLVVIESTILPSWLDTVVKPALRGEGLEIGRDVLVGAAPRRDWFNGDEYTIENLPRIVGGCDDETTRLLVAFYGLICAVVQPAMDAQHAAFTKVIENVMRYQGISLANHLALAFPQFDMRHVLALASTKWNIPLYYPSLGIGGHCIPLAPQYLMEEGGPDNQYLAPVQQEIEFNGSYFEELLARRLMPLLRGKRSVGVLGLAYTPNAKMHKLSPAFSVLDALRHVPRLRLHDPCYSRDEIEDLCSVPPLAFPHGLADCDAVILVTAHTDYIRSPVEQHIMPGTTIIDNTGVWSRREFAAGVQYYEVGRIPGRRPESEPSSALAD